MLLQLLIMIGGGALLLAGGELLVRGSSALATRLGVNPTLIGLTVVAMGTSAPELIVCLLAAGRDQPDIAFGNVFGSNMANAGLLIGITALIAPFQVQSGIVKYEMPLLLVGAVLAIALGADTLLGAGTLQEAGGTIGTFDRGDGLVLLVLFSAFLLFTLRNYIRPRGDNLGEEVMGTMRMAGKESRSRICLGITLGVVGLVAGGEMVVRSAIEVARALEIPEVVIAVTAISVGTSLPELVTVVSSARKGMQDLALGNVVGSNLFNLLLVLGATATYRTVPVPSEGGGIDLIANAIISIALLFVALRGRDVTRREGLFMLALYAGYVAQAVSR